jgi:hypothetical protein
MKLYTLVVLGLVLSSRLCNADVPAVIPGTGGSENDAWNGDATIGWQFTLATSVTVTELGFLTSTGSLHDSHPVGIWNSSGTLLGSATVPAGAAATLVDGFDFVSIPSLVLGPGSYAMGGYGNETSLDQFEFSEIDSTTISGLTFGGAVETFASSLTFPTAPEGFATQGYFGPNFMVAVPEPSVMGLAAGGFVMLLFYRRPTAASRVKTV